MKVCNEIRRQVDEADDVESFDLDIARHTAVCDDCRRFAGERAALRELIASTTRVNAPLNFDAMLHARLAEVKARRPLAWLNAAFYLRAGAAMAALMVAVFVAQYTGLFAPPSTKPVNLSNTESPSVAQTQATSEQPPQVGVSSPASSNNPTPANDAAPGGLAIVTTAGHASNRPRPANAGTRRNAGVPLMTAEEAGMVDGGAIFIPGRNGEHDVTVPTVSVGAQSLIYVNSGRQQQSARAVSVSF
jgi:hypothetical protein